ncbi:LysR family transcriptional regulator [Roseburia sp. OF03-24]|uniref:winged helix-turn-helix domain-containing protein n=1 Tax=unclassified Roseburia TaxID=2637578 RepID=UPI000E545D92|nr:MULTISPECIES: LysR family transcriptional regulator [unclassified Roseburia]RGX93219.1 LysR family transcriptional regulator [Roseburia sp. OF03-24]RHF91096.1 LysR family transcriptional regulator [Roseburia sp. AM23-20]
MSLGKRKLHEQVRLRIYGDELIFGPGIAQIMELVEKTGSLSEACRQMQMAYSKGWRIVKRAENELGFSLMTGNSGGKGGGNMTLTEQGRNFLEKYQAMDAELKKDAQTLFEKYFTN